MIETLQPATDAVAKISQYGLAGVCVLLIFAVVYMAKMLLGALAKSNQIIADHIIASSSLQQSLKDVVSNNTKATENNTIATVNSVEILKQMQLSVAACPKK